jgi:hypothetical protein
MTATGSVRVSRRPPLPISEANRNIVMLLRQESRERSGRGIEKKTASTFVSFLTDF